MTFRMGNTGMNWPDHPVEPHTHNALWRVDMDLNGWPSDTATWLLTLGMLAGRLEILLLVLRFTRAFWRA